MTESSYLSKQILSRFSVDAAVLALLAPPSAINYLGSGDANVPLAPLDLFVRGVGIWPSTPPFGCWHGLSPSISRYRLLMDAIENLNEKIRYRLKYWRRSRERLKSSVLFQTTLAVEEYLEPVQVNKEYCDVSVRRDESLFSYVMGLFEQRLRLRRGELIYRHFKPIFAPISSSSSLKIGQHCAQLCVCFTLKIRTSIITLSVPPWFNLGSSFSWPCSTEIYIIGVISTLFIVTVDCWVLFIVVTCIKTKWVDGFHTNQDLPLTAAANGVCILFP